MSYGFRTRVRAMIAQLQDVVSEEELKNIMEWCPISDEVIGAKFPNEDIDAIIQEMTDEEFKDFVIEVLRRYRARNKKAAEETTEDTKKEKVDDEEEEIKEEIEE